MEVNYDWKNFQSFFYPKKKKPSEETSSSPISVVTDKNMIISVLAPNEDLSEWLGASCDEMMAQFPNRQVLIYEREKVDQWIQSSVDLPHYFDQLQALRAHSKPRNEVFGRQHFLLEALQTWWQKIFPSTYGVFVELSGGRVDSLLLIVQKGKIKSFHSPDLSGMVPQRRHVPADIVKYLSERYLIPVQGIFVSAGDWAEWSELPDPWKNLAAAIKRNRNQLVPFRWSLASLIAGRAYLRL